MNAKRIGRVMVAVLIVAMLGGAYLIVAASQTRVPAAAGEKSSGFYH